MGFGRAILVLVLAGGLSFEGAVLAKVFEVMPTVETDPVPHSGDRADDATIWVHPVDANLSVIIGTDKDDSDGGLVVYDLTGRQMSFTTGGKMNNVDVRYNFPLAGETADIIAVGNRTDNSIAVYTIDPDTRQLTDIAARKIYIGIEEAYGFCLYQSWRTNKYYAFVNDKEGWVEQWELFADPNGRVDAFMVRSFDVGTQTEGMVADDQLGYVYIGEEDVGIWRYGAEPTAPAGVADRFMVDTTGAGGHLAADVEGLTLYCAAGHTGYLIASSQGEGNSGHPMADTYAVYRRDGNNEHVMNFRIVANYGLDIDKASDTDGIVVVSASLGSAFPYGMFVAQDSPNTGGNQNFKAVPWEAIATEIEPNLLIDTSRSPRSMCGSKGYLPGDLNRDCRVDAEDMELLAANWLAAQ